MHGSAILMELIHSANGCRESSGFDSNVHESIGVKGHRRVLQTGIGERDLQFDDDEK